MNPRWLTVAAVALCLTVVVIMDRTVARRGGLEPASSGAVRPPSIAGLGPVSHSVDSRFVQELQAIAMGTVPRGDANKAPVTEQVDGGDMTVASLEQGRPAELSPSAIDVQPVDVQPVDVPTAGPPDLMLYEPNQALGSIETFDECLNVDVCVDRYLWKLYERTPKEDTIKVEDRRKVKVKRKGKTITVTRTFTRLVDENFAWKDPQAADKVNMPMIDYVIGGMDRIFKLKLFHALRAAEQAGLSPGITSAFRDDYRQSIASGLKAASDRSYHGGSFRGGYGPGLAADVVSVKGATRAERWVSTEALWKWLDENGSEFGIGRPYLDRDPPHLAPIDGKEWADHRGTKTQDANADQKKAQGSGKTLAAR
jgi:hypothetical protein